MTIEELYRDLPFSDEAGPTRAEVRALLMAVLEEAHGVATEFTSEAHCTGQGCDYCTNLALVRAHIDSLPDA